MRKPAWVRKSGPFKCASRVDGYILVRPSWPQYGPVWKQMDGGGPGFPGRMRLAEDLERWLNSSYSEAEVAEAAARIAEHEVNLKDWGKIVLPRRMRQTTCGQCGYEDARECCPQCGATE